MTEPHLSVAAVSFRAAIIAMPVLAFLGAIVWAVLRNRDQRGERDVMLGAYGDMPFVPRTLSDGVALRPDAGGGGSKIPSGSAAARDRGPRHG